MPGTSSALWSSSNDNIHHNKAPREGGIGSVVGSGVEGGGVTGLTMNAANRGGMEDDVMMASLGSVLSSVNITSSGGGDVDGGGGSGHGGVGGGSYGAPGTAVGSSQTVPWGSLAPAPAGVLSYRSYLSGRASLSYNFYGNGGGNAHRPSNAAKSGGGSDHDSLQNILYDSGIYEAEDYSSHQRRATVSGPVVVPTGASPATPTNADRERKASIDIFLSQSPSRALGEDAFRVMHRTLSNPSLVNLYPNKSNNKNNSGQQEQQQQHHHANDNMNGGLKQLASTAPSSRSESPSQQNHSRGGTGMASAANNGVAGSSYNDDAAIGRQAYPSCQFTGNSAANTFSHGGNQQQQHGNLNSQLLNPQQLPLTSPGLVNNGQYLLQQQQQQQILQPQYIPMPVVPQQQSQVFYMAVPAPDGKGQVLQPVQMVQIPGQAGTIMMPVAAANGGNSQQQFASSDVNLQGQMMLLHPLQANGGMGSNNVYGQGNGRVGNNDGGSGNQYSQYGNAVQQQQQQQSLAYDNRYAKNSANDGLGEVGQYQNDQRGNSSNHDQVLNGSLSNLYSSSERPTLRALLGNVRRLSRDQVGCRLLQQALDEDGPSAATAILNEGLTFWAEAMVDPFGNYLFQKILERITPAERVTLVGSVSTRLVNASLNLHGTRSVQKIVEVCSVDEDFEESGHDEVEVEGEGEVGESNDGANKTRSLKKRKETAAKILTDALKPSAARLCIDSHGNHAIQRILLKLPYKYTQFIFDAVAASVEDVARHRHGCCVIQRCLDSRHSTARTHLVTRIVEKSLELMQDAYGNYVVQYVLDVCGDDEVHSVCESVIGKVCILAIQKFSSNVMEKCLERCTDRVREEYLNELNDSDRLRELMMDPFGNYVVQRALSVSTHAQAIRLVETMKPHLSSQNGGGIRNTAGGRRILGKICRRFPNFVLEGETFEDYDLNQVLARDSSPHHQRGGGRHQNQFGMHPQLPGPSPNSQRRNGRPRNQQQLQLHGHHGNFIQSDLNVMTAYHHDTGANPYLFPHSM
ncbi:hypothetical protein ACHAXA_005641 [Cyclostephanos tholiformis]|uniref:PUM-HD domain-containing protein n=1 Tax=Cyclostephanos tholiformis TaxID=382380 RepID=A0ABD3RC21_9STRA